MTKKVILLGKFGVGKTSLISQFVHSKFSEQYLTTIGVKIDKKVVNIDGTELSMIIWDIAGENSQAKVPDNYKLGSHGVFFVFDVTRPSTYEHMQSELELIRALIPDAPIKVLANKADLIADENLNDLISSFDQDILLCSAKTGENVEEAFYQLGLKML